MALVASSPAETGPLSAGKSSLKLAGFAFVNSSVTAHGGAAKLARGTKIYRSGSTIRGRTGCPTTRYQTDGLLVLVIDYKGRPTAASVTVTRRLAGSGQTFTNAPYYLDLDAGRRLQYLGPIFENGTYGVVARWGFNSGKGSRVSGKLVLARTCPVFS